VIAVKRRIYKEKRRKRDRQGREKALLAAATRLFAAQGYEATTTREIAAAARCAEGLIHRYFQGKAGLLGAMVKAELSRNGCDRLDEHVPAPRFEDEILRLVHWEVERVWSEREFLRVMIPQLLKASDLGREGGQLIPHAHRAEAIVERLKLHEQCRSMPPEQIEALAQLISTVGFVFGFLRPEVLHHDRTRSKEAAGAMVRSLMRSSGTASSAGGESSEYTVRRASPAELTKLAT